MGKVIGIDLGTTNSVCAVVDGSEPRVVINEEGGRVTPSVVGFAKDGSRFVGDIAKRQLLINPQATIHSIKRFMGKAVTEVQEQAKMVQYAISPDDTGGVMVQIGDRAFSPQEISALVLQKVKKAAEDYLGESVTEAVITVPAYFTDRQRQATRDAGTIAGLDVLRIINEPTAAALAYVHDKSEESTIAVYDWGGGTFDISILRVGPDIAEVLSTRGNNLLGGADVDQCVVTWLQNEFMTDTGIDVSEDAIVMQRLRDAAERAKVELSVTQATEVHLPFLVADESGPRHLQTQLTRENFESLAGHLFKETIDECSTALVDAELEAGDVDEIIMVGGSSRIPMIQTMVQDLFGQPLNKSFNPDEVVAIGAAIQAAMLSGHTKAVTLLDVTNFSLGIEVEGRRMAKLIPKNTTIPTQAMQLVSTVQKNQKTVKIHVLQGEHDDATKNVSMGQFELHNIQPGERGVPRVEVKFSIDANGIVTVSSRDLRTGVSDEIEIESPIGLSQAEINAMRGDITGEPEDPEVDLIRGQIEAVIVDIEEHLIANKGELHKKLEEQTEQALKRGRNALLKSRDPEKLGEMLEYLKTSQDKLSS
jgi:molecular chaperone DnaK